MSAAAFAREVARVLPEEAQYAYHRRLTEDPVHVPRRDPDARLLPGEMVVPDCGWRLVLDPRSSQILQGAVQDFQDYLATSMQVKVGVYGRAAPLGGPDLGPSIDIGTREPLPGCGATLRGPKGYESHATSRLSTRWRLRGWSKCPNTYMNRLFSRRTNCPFMAL